MNVVTRATMNLEQFLAWEEQQENRYEYDGFRPLAMTGGTVSHSLIQVGLLAALVPKLRGGPCRAHGSHLKLQLATTARYPDAFVSCASVDASAVVVTEPVVIFEILSPTTKAENLIRKSAEYRGSPSVQRYVVIEQTHISATSFSRKGDLWITDAIAGRDAILDMPEIGVSLTLGEIYADIEEQDEASGP